MMSNNTIFTRSKLVRSPPAARKAAPQPSTSSHEESPPISPELVLLDNSVQSPAAAEKSTSNTRDDAIMRALSDIKDIVRGLDRKFTDKIDNLSESVSSVKQEVAAVRQEVSNLIASQISEHTDQLAVHDTRLDAVEASMRELRNTFEAATKATDLIIKGVPMLPNDNPVKIYVDIAQVIGYDKVSTPSANIARLGKKKPDGKFDPPLLVKFVNITDKIEFFRRYFHHSQLNLSEIGFTTRQRIYVSENLTKQDQEVHATAMKLRYERKLASVSTSRGVVHVRRNREDRPMPVKAVSELMNLVGDAGRQNEGSN
jgi:hypothetical protein